MTAEAALDPTMRISKQDLNAWNAALEDVRGRSTSFEKWFSSVQLDSLEGNVLNLTARNEFVRDWVTDHFLPPLLERLCENLVAAVQDDDGSAGEVRDGGLQVAWKISAELERPVVAPLRDDPEDRAVESTRTRVRTRRAPEPAPESEALRDQLNPKYTFDNFVVGPSNELAYAAALSSARDPRPATTRSSSTAARDWARPT